MKGDSVYTRPVDTQTTVEPTTSSLLILVNDSDMESKISLTEQRRFQLAVAVRPFGRGVAAQWRRRGLGWPYCESDDSVAKSTDTM